MKIGRNLGEGFVVRFNCVACLMDFETLGVDCYCFDMVP